MAAVVGSLAYNVTMTLGAAALVRPLRIADAGPIRWPAVATLAALARPIFLAHRGKQPIRRSGVLLLAAYPLYLVLALIA